MSRAGTFSPENNAPTLQNPRYLYYCSTERVDIIADYRWLEVCLVNNAQQAAGVQAADGIHSCSPNHEPTRLPTSTLTTRPLRNDAISYRFCTPLK